MGGGEWEDDVAGLFFLSFPLARFYLEELTWRGLALRQVGCWDAVCLDAANSTVIPVERPSVLVFSSLRGEGLEKQWQADTSFPSL